MNLGTALRIRAAPGDEEKIAQSATSDLTTPIPEFQGANAPQIPAVVGSFTAAQESSMVPSSSQTATIAVSGTAGSGSVVASHRSGVSRQRQDFNSRCVWPLRNTVDPGTTDFNNLTTPGFTNYTGAPPLVQGVPQMHLSNPFPATYPVQSGVPEDHSVGTRSSATARRFINWTGLARTAIDSTSRFSGNCQPAWFWMSRITSISAASSSIPRETSTWWIPTSRIQYKDAVNQQVPNPFYNILPVDKFPGPLRYQQTVSISSLMRPYPQYGDLNVIDGQPGGNMKYQSLQIELQKNFTTVIPSCSDTTTITSRMSDSSTTSRRTIRNIRGSTRLLPGTV